MVTRGLVVAGIVGLVASVAALSAAARENHRRRPIATASHQTPAPKHQFYPENVPGGVPGNLPFNNQLRKLSDPLNANGAGH